MKRRSLVSRITKSVLDQMRVASRWHSNARLFVCQFPRRENYTPADACCRTSTKAFFRLLHLQRQLDGIRSRIVSIQDRSISRQSLSVVVIYQLSLNRKKEKRKRHRNGDNRNRDIILGIIHRLPEAYCKILRMKPKNRGASRCLAALIKESRLLIERYARYVVYRCCKKNLSRKEKIMSNW